MPQWLLRLFGHHPQPDPSHQALDREQLRIAERLGALKGVTRDEVLKQAYRRARVLDESESYRR